MAKQECRGAKSQLFPCYASSCGVRHTSHATVNQMVRDVGWNPGKISKIRRNAPSSRQPLVKGERLVRSELGAAMTVTGSAAVPPQ